jgi:DNA polymerase delta subunit 2
MTLTITPVTRAYSSHVPKWQRFQTNIIKPSQKVAKAEADGAHPYMKQYAHVYYQRLCMLRPRCWKSVEEDADKSGEALRVDRILELMEGKLSVVVGTLVREPGDEKTTLHPDSQCRAGDSLFLEDESGRVKLRVDQKHFYPTGIVLAVRGTVGNDGVLVVTKLYSPALPDYSVALPTSEATNDADSTPHLLILSGLHCGDPNVSSLPRELLISFLEGRFGVDKAMNVSRIILAGGLTSPDPIAVKDLDSFCLSLASTGIPLDVFPGRDDPTTANWPQRPIHRSLLQKTDKNLGKLLFRTPNPYAATHDGMYVIGTDGTNVKDLCQFVLKEETDSMSDDDGLRYTCISHLEALGQTLEWCHICPTGPDSVPTAPHATQDPMVLNEICPSIYFCGNVDKFATKLYNDKTRLICVPKFSENGEAVLVNLETLAVELLRFDE